MKRSFFTALGLISILFMFAFGKCFGDFADSVVITLDNQNLLTSAYFTIKPAPTPGDQGVSRSYSVKEINDSLAAITTKLKLKTFQLKDVVTYTLSSFDLSIVSPSTLKFSAVDFVSLTISAPGTGLPDAIIFKNFYNNANTNSITIPVPESDIKNYMNAALAKGNDGVIKYTLNLFTNKPITDPVVLHAVPHGRIELLTQ